ncbi:hypothetical protein [Tenacibaculum soleae]|uniref:hypothetical protein n=1 Tax=Tenacibaculum soleae TaxID=447689 RepID=UPI0023019E90|nr:hypothetical protein [Tenacibaculum soleae]
MNPIAKIKELKSKIKKETIDDVDILNTLTEIIDNYEVTEKDIFIEDIEAVKHELQDTFNIYLDTDIAGDNDDRRNKLNAFTKTLQLLKAM